MNRLRCIYWTVRVHAIPGRPQQSKSPKYHQKNGWVSEWMGLATNNRTISFTFCHFVHFQIHSSSAVTKKKKGEKMESFSQTLHRFVVNSNSSSGSSSKSGGSNSGQHRIVHVGTICPVRHSPSPDSRHEESPTMSRYRDSYLIHLRHFLRFNATQIARK